MNSQEVKQIARKMVAENGLINLSRRALCKRAGIPDGSFPLVVGCTFSELVDEIKAEAPANFPGIVSKRRANSGLRKNQLLGVALDLAIDDGYTQITRAAIAEKAGVSMSLVTNYFGSMKQLKRSVMRAAVERRVPEVVAQGLANGDPQARKAPPELREQAAQFLINA